MRDHQRDQDDVEAICARLRVVLEETRGLGRRDFLRALGKAGLAALAPASPGSASRARAAEPPVTMLTYGGAWKQAIIEAFGEPFTKKTGIAVQYQEPYCWAKLRAMHDAKAQQIDVVGITGTEVILAERLKMMTPIDWSLVDRGALDARQLHHANAIGGASQSMVVCYSRKKWPGDVHPNSWADFWNVEKFPGRRALRRYAGWTDRGRRQGRRRRREGFLPARRRARVPQPRPHQAAREGVVVGQLARPAADGAGGGRPDHDGERARHPVDPRPQGAVRDRVERGAVRRQQPGLDRAGRLPQSDAAA